MQPGNQDSDSLAARYQRLAATGRITDDAAQREVLAALERLARQLGRARTRLFFGKNTAPMTGLYIWGPVGRGKSMLMDLFFDYAPVARKRRVHFHAFMQEMHGRIHQLRQKGDGDPVALLARQLAQDASLLCFDELQATDVTDATLLYRLFAGLFEADVVVVSTSNRPPAALYTGGIQAERFAKFIALIESHMQVMALPSPVDYRQAQDKCSQARWFAPLGRAAAEFIEDAVRGMAPQQATLSVHGRTTPFTLYPPATGRFTFQELCESALGAADYLALAKRLDMLILTGIPLLTLENRNEAKRFVTLIDALYEHKVQLIATAAALPERLYPEGDGAFEFRRTVSRLAEMQSERWMKG